jgi:signal peptidase II
MKRSQFFAIFSLFILDRVSKLWAMVELSDTVVNWSGIVRLNLVLNRGLGWSLFATDAAWGQWIFVGIAFLLIGALFVHARNEITLGRSPAPEFLVIAGGISNVMDRVQYGGVIDFIDLFIGQYQWPTTFNLADLYILVGISLLVLKVVVYGNDGRKN